jgi:hypothetical protein
MGNRHEPPRLEVSGEIVYIRPRNCGSGQGRNITPRPSQGGDTNTPAKVALLGLTPTICPLLADGGPRGGCPSLLPLGAPRRRGQPPRDATHTNSERRRGRSSQRRHPPQTRPCSCLTPRIAVVTPILAGCSSGVALAASTVVTMVRWWACRRTLRRPAPRVATARLL